MSEVLLYGDALSRDTHSKGGEVARHAYQYKSHTNHIETSRTLRVSSQVSATQGKSHATRIRNDRCSKTLTAVKIQGYLAHTKQRPPSTPTVGLCLGPYGGPAGGLLFLMSEVPLYLGTDESQGPDSRPG